MKAKNLNLNDFESITNLNQSSNENFFSKINKFLIKKFSLICFMIFSIIFILIGIIYKNSCLEKSDLSLFLIIFGILILINLFIYTILGATFLALLRHTRTFTLEKGIGIFLATLFGIIFGLIIFIWWIIGTIWWIKLTISIKSKLIYPNSLAFCHPIVYWTSLVANILGLIGFIIQICIAIEGGMTASKQSSKDRGG